MADAAAPVKGAAGAVVGPTGTIGAVVVFAPRITVVTVPFPLPLPFPDGTGLPLPLGLGTKVTVAMVDGMYVVGVMKVMLDCTGVEGAGAQWTALVMVVAL
jgi:hypothetical protein